MNIQEVKKGHIGFDAGNSAAQLGAGEVGRREAMNTAYHLINYGAKGRRPVTKTIVSARYRRTNMDKSNKIDNAITVLIPISTNIISGEGAEYIRTSNNVYDPIVQAALLKGVCPVTLAFELKKAGYRLNTPKSLHRIPRYVMRNMIRRAIKSIRKDRITSNIKVFKRNEIS